TEATHQRCPSLTSWMLLMPRTKGFSSDGARRDSYVEKTWQTLPKQSVRRETSLSKNDDGSPFCFIPAIDSFTRCSKPSTSSTVNMSLRGFFGGMSMPTWRKRLRMRSQFGCEASSWETDA